ncbi:MAG: pyridoxamine 5'-phosphate oxidase family protein [Actinophytocola sp.]|nr:pyridoxamine 5'-phosphate oxidase family protein [Actinophytocola sp.]
MPTDPKRMRELSPGEALRRLGSVPIGRVVFTIGALPAIRPVNHLLVDGDVILRCHEGAALMKVVGQVVAYQADLIDPETHIGWSVIATGKATLVEDRDAIARYESRLRPWVDRDMSYVIRIHPGIVTGYELVDNGDSV